jgi:hypothetical protein
MEPTWQPSGQSYPGNASHIAHFLLCCDEWLITKYMRAILLIDGLPDNI